MSSQNETMEKLKKLKQFQKDGDLTLFEMILDMEQEVKAARDTLLKGFDNISTLDLEKIRGEPGVDGIRGKPGLDGKDGRDGKDGVNGKDGKTGAKGAKGDKGEAGKPGKDGKDGNTITAQELRNKLESLDDDERLNIGAIANLQDILNELKEFQDDMAKERIKISMSGGAGSGGSASTFLGLTDTPAAYGTAGQSVVVNAGGTGLEFTTTSGSNIYSADGSLAGARNVTMNGNSLTFTGSSETTVISSTGNIVALDGGNS